VPRYADILPFPGRDPDRAFTYQVPLPLRDRVRPGVQVLVPFSGRPVPGLVVEMHDREPERELLPVSQVFPEAPALPPVAPALAAWMAEQYWCTLGQAMRCFLPEGGTWQVQPRVAITSRGLAASVATLAAEHAEAGRAIRLVLEHDGTLPLSRLQRVLGEDAAGRAVAWLRDRGLVEIAYTADPPAVRTRTERQVSSPLPSAALLALANRLPARQASRATLLRYLADHPEPQAASRLAEQAGVSTSVVGTLLRQGVLQERIVQVRRRPWEFVTPDRRPPVELTAGQRQALAAILGGCQGGAPRVFLLHGVTASGKTEVYLRAAEWVIAQERQAIILVPEISLSAQTLAIFAGRFGQRVALLHSALTAGERYDEWQRVMRGEAQVIVGARSALFAPCPRLGLIVLDEEHEPSYKQEHVPAYHAREVAIARARLEGAAVVLGSATPALESYHAAREGRYTLLEMPERVDGRPQPEAALVDLRAAGRQRIFTPRLLLAMKQACDRGEQVMLFVNRRGYANFMLCPACGHVPTCPACDLAYTFHLQGGMLRCHHCGRSDRPAETCPRCGGREVDFAGFGTERVEQDLARVMPGASARRMDRDTTSAKGSHARILQAFRTGEAQVLIGTQMIAKGLDFPSVTVVGVLCADTSLRLPDLRAGERTFQLLTQVAGRTGRGEKPGLVVVQTYDPEHYAVQAALRADYRAFYEQELASRREHGFPPFARMCRLLLTGTEENAVAKQAGMLAGTLERARAQGDRLLGPSPAPLARIAGRSRWHLLLLSPTREGLGEWLRRGEIRPGAHAGIRVSLDFDPISTM